MVAMRREFRDRVVLAFAVVTLVSLTPLTGDAAPADPKAEVGATLQAQAEAWNRGDIPAFVASYEHSGDTIYTGGGEVVQGWDAILQRYTSHYPGPEARGTLSLKLSEVTMLGPDAALTWGHWFLQRKEPVGGVFTLVLRRGPQGWRIIHDHTSVSKAKP